jgi:7-keto-8-aminopelargonate synthetase-like enzyme
MVASIRVAPSRVRPGGQGLRVYGTGGAVNPHPDYSDYGPGAADPTNLVSIRLIAYAALGEIGTRLNKDGLPGGSNSYFGLIDHNDVRSSVQAYVNAATLNAGGDVTLTAFETARIASQDSSDVQPWTGLGAVIVTNVVLDAADAYMTSGSVSGDTITLDAENVAQIDATATSTTSWTRPARCWRSTDRLEALQTRCSTWSTR